MLFFSTKKKFCFFIAAFILLFFAFSAAPTSVLVSSDEVVEWRCPRCPICSKGGAHFLTRLRYCFLSSFFRQALFSLELPFATNKAVRLHVIEDLKELLTHLVGQPHLTETILDAMRRKMAFPQEPLILHFAGDNGVGKTYTARLLSLATSLRCAPSRPRCDVGDNMLVISGTGFDGMSLAEAREQIMKRVVAHQKKYPHGILLLDDLTAMHPKLVTALAPLFGRAERFLEQAENTPSLANLLIVVTTDLGQQGRTYGKSLAQIEQLVREDFTSLYGTLVPAFTRTLLFLAFTRRDAEEMVRHAVSLLPCADYWTQGSVLASSIDDLAVAFLVEQHKETWEGKENGHALKRVVEDNLITLLLQYFDKNGYDKRVWARFHLDESVLKIVLSTGEQVEEKYVVDRSYLDAVIAGDKREGAKRHAEGDVDSGDTPSPSFFSEDL